MNDGRCAPGVRAAGIRVLLVEDETLVGEAICALLAQTAHIMVVGQAGTAAAALHQAQRLQPDVMLLDLHLPDCPGTAVIQALRQAAPAVQVLVLTAYAEPSEVAAALKAGAIGYVLKTQAITELVAAITQAYHGQSCLHPTVASILLAELSCPAARSTAGAALSKAEHCILVLVAQGCSNKEIACHVGVSLTTVRAHVSSILHKLQLANRTQATLYALKQGLAKLG